MWEIQVRLVTAKPVCTWKYYGSPITVSNNPWYHIFPFLLTGLRYQSGSGVHTAWCSFSVVKWLGNGVDQSPPSPAKVKNEWSCTCASAIHLHGLPTYSVPFFFKHAVAGLANIYTGNFKYYWFIVFLLWQLNGTDIKIYIYTYKCNCVNKMSYSYNYFFVSCHWGVLRIGKVGHLWMRY
jgi:hypothetical protein